MNGGGVMALLLGAAAEPAPPEPEPEPERAPEPRPQPAACADVDPCVVETAPLAGILEDFVTGWRTTRPSRRGQFGKAATDVEPLGAYEALSHWTDLSEDEIKRMRRPELHPYTELRVADALVASIGEPAMFHGPEPLLRIQPNPETPDRAHECCGGSESF